MKQKLFNFVFAFVAFFLLQMIVTAGSQELRIGYGITNYLNGRNGGANTNTGNNPSGNTHDGRGPSSIPGQGGGGEGGGGDDRNGNIMTDGPGGEEGGSISVEQHEQEVTNTRIGTAAGGAIGTGLARVGYAAGAAAAAELGAAGVTWGWVLGPLGWGLSIGMGAL